MLLLKDEKEKGDKYLLPPSEKKGGGEVVVVVVATIKKDVGSCSQRNSFHLPSNEEFMSLKVASFISFGLAV